MRRSLLNATTLAALFVAALVANLRLAGTSPIAWIDTFNDESEVQQCLVNDSCTLTGVSTSVPGQAHAVAWLELRTLLAWLGVGLDGAHLVMQLLSALAVVLVFHLAAQLGGPLAGVAAVWIVMDRVDAFVRATALYNTTPLLFLGAVFVLACTAVLARPGVVSVALAALVAAVMANVHLACAMTGASVVWVALTAPRRRVLLAAFGAALFATATVVMAPPSWLHNLRSLLEHGGVSPHPIALNVPRNPMMGWALFAVCAWVVSLPIRAPAWVDYRRRSHGAIAVIVPSLAVFIVASRFGLNPEVRYLFHVKAACAVAAALPVGLVAGAMLRALSSRWLLLAAERILPFALAVVIVFAGRLGVGADVVTAKDERTPTVRDLTAVAHVLHDEHGWDVARMLEGLGTPHGLPVLAGLRHLTPADDGRIPVTDLESRALLMIVDAEDLPDPLPSSWKVVRRSSQSATVLVFTRSRIDWRTFEVCVQAAGASQLQCEHSGWRFDDVSGIFVPNMPPAGAGWRGTLRLRLRLGPAIPGTAEEIFMPRMPLLCGGRIVSLAGGGAYVDPAGRHAAVSPAAPGGSSPPLVELEWHVGSPECDVLAYDGLPPFVVGGDPETVRLVEAILSPRSRRTPGRVSDCGQKSSDFAGWACGPSRLRKREG